MSDFFRNAITKFSAGGEIKVNKEATDRGPWMRAVLPLAIAGTLAVMGSVVLDPANEGGRAPAASLGSYVSPEQACAATSAGLLERRLATSNVDAIGVLDSQSRFGLSDRQVQDVSQFTALMNLSKCIDRVGAYSTPNMPQTPALAQANAFRDHMAENRAVVFATLATAREGKGVEAAMLYGKIHAVASVTSAAQRGQAVNPAVTETSRALVAAVGTAVRAGKDGLAHMSVDEISALASELGSNMSYPPNLLQEVGRQLSDTRVDSSGALEVDSALPFQIRMLVTMATEQHPFQVRPEDRILSTTTLSAASPSYENTSEPYAVDPNLEERVQPLLYPGERLISTAAEADTNGSVAIYIHTAKKGIELASVSSSGDLVRGENAEPTRAPIRPMR